jgi:hypothetical protein
MLQNQGASLTVLACELLERVGSAPILSYWIPAFALYVGTVGIALASAWRADGAEPRRVGALFNALLCLCLLFFKWPFFSLWEMNPDESQIIASAITLRKDPFFWRSVDAGSHGPLVEYCLLLPSYLGIRIDYGLARAVGLVCAAGSLVLVQLSARGFFSVAASRLAVLPFFTFLVMTNYKEYLSFNAELPAILLISLALWLISRLRVVRLERSSMLAAGIGVVLGSAPYVKLQGVPVACAAGVWALVEIWLRFGRTRKTAAMWSVLAVGGLASTALLLVSLFAADLEHDFYVRYIAQNFSYVTRHGKTLVEKLLLFYSDYGRFGESTNLFLGGIQALLAGLLLIAGGVALWRRFRLRGVLSQRGATRDGMTRIACSALLYCASVYAVATPGNFFAHYYLFLFVTTPFLYSGLLFFIGLPPSSIWGRRAVFLAFLVFGALFQLANEKSYALRSNVFPSEHNCVGLRSHLAIDGLLRMATPDDAISVWGWAYHFSISSGLPLGTRTTPMHIFGLPALNKYYLEAYLKEIKAAKPAFFIDATAPGMFYLDSREIFGFERIPQLQAFIKAHYALLEEIGEIRVYASKEKLRSVRVPVSQFGAFLGEKLSFWREKWGEGVFFLDPRILATDAVIPYTAATVFPPPSNVGGDERLEQLVADLLLALDSGAPERLARSLRGRETQPVYIVTRVALPSAARDERRTVEVEGDLYVYQIR